MTCTLYGISNCDTVRKARRWLDAEGVTYEFHDLRIDGTSTGMLHAWLEHLSWEELINRRSTTWKTLSPEAREGMTQETAVAAALKAPTLIKRPVLETQNSVEVGFNPQRYKQLLLA